MSRQRKPGHEPPEVSVVLVTYNRAHLLERTLKSLLAQDFDDFELLICDDASPDGSLEVAQETCRGDDRVRILPAHRNQGMPENLNRGIREARGRFIANLHDGDIYAPELLRTWRDALLDCPDAAFVFNAYRMLLPNGATREIESVEGIEECVSGHKLIERHFFRRKGLNSPVWGTVMARREIYDRLGLFDPRYREYADVDMWLRMAEVYSVAYVSEPLITIPSREEVPQQWTTSRRQAWRTVEAVFEAAVRRHWEGRFVRRSISLSRHWLFVLYGRAYRCALTARRRAVSRSDQFRARWPG